MEYSSPRTDRPATGRTVIRSAVLWVALPLCIPLTAEWLQQKRGRLEHSDLFRGMGKPRSCSRVGQGAEPLPCVRSLPLKPGGGKAKHSARPGSKPQGPVGKGVFEAAPLVGGDVAQQTLNVRMTLALSLMTAIEASHFEDEELAQQLRQE